MTGRSVSADERLNGPAIWKAVVEGRRIREWHVDEDTPEGRQRLGHDASEEENRRSQDGRSKDQVGDHPGFDI